MVTLYLAGKSIRLESKITVSERMLERYKKFKEEMPKEFSISRTRRGCFAYLNQRYTGSNVAAQAENLENENKKIIEHLAKMKTEDELNLNSCVRVLRKHGHNLLAGWLYGKLASVLEAQDGKVEKEPEPCDGCVLSINCNLDTHAQELIRDIQNKKWSEEDIKK